MVEYEWVVERIDPESEDILDCSYWPEAEFAEAILIFNAWSENSSDCHALGLCRNHWQDGYLLRDYSYFTLEGRLAPEWNDDGPNAGRAIPKRFLAREVPAAE